MGDVLDAIAGPGAIAMLLDEYVQARKGVVLECAAGHIGAFHVVLVRVGEGPRVCMSVPEARNVAHYCLATELMPPAMREAVADHLAELARHLIELADDADAMQPQRLH